MGEDASVSVDEAKSVGEICAEFNEKQNRNYKRFLIDLRSACETRNTGYEKMISALRKLRINQKKLARRSLSKEISVSELCVQIFIRFEEARYKTLCSTPSDLQESSSQLSNSFFGDERAEEENRHDPLSKSDMKIIKSILGQISICSSQEEAQKLVKQVLRPVYWKRFSKTITLIYEYLDLSLPEKTKKADQKPILSLSSSNSEEKIESLEFEISSLDFSSIEPDSSKKRSRSTSSTAISKTNENITAEKLTEKKLKVSDKENKPAKNQRYITNSLGQAPLEMNKVILKKSSKKIDNLRKPAILPAASRSLSHQQTKILAYSSPRAPTKLSTPLRSNFAESP